MHSQSLSINNNTYTGLAVLHVSIVTALNIIETPDNLGVQAKATPLDVDNNLVESRVVHINRAFL